MGFDAQVDHHVHVGQVAEALGRAVEALVRVAEVVAGTQTTVVQAQHVLQERGLFTDLAVNPDALGVVLVEDCVGVAAVNHAQAAAARVLLPAPVQLVLTSAQVDVLVRCPTELGNLDQVATGPVETNRVLKLLLKDVAREGGLGASDAEVPEVSAVSAAFAVAYFVLVFHADLDARGHTHFKTVRLENQALFAERCISSPLAAPATD